MAESRWVQSKSMSVPLAGFDKFRDQPWYAAAVDDSVALTRAGDVTGVGQRSGDPLTVVRWCDGVMLPRQYQHGCVGLQGIFQIGIHRRLWPDIADGLQGAQLIRTEVGLFEHRPSRLRPC